MHLRNLRHDLVVRRVNKAVELDLAYRAVPANGESNGGPDDAGLGERSVHHPLLAEVLLQTVGNSEDAAQLSDVLTHDENLRVILERFAQTFVQRLAEGHRGGRAH